MELAYTVLYVHDYDASLAFWINTMGMVTKACKHAGPFEITQVGFENDGTFLELVPLALMAENPHGLDLATPSIAFRVDDLAFARERLTAKGVEVSEISEMGEITSFAFSDNEHRWFAVLQK
jgi:catechol 2,3-dioxygenase-like lactoylglutathione lyase family enzyme